MWTISCKSKASIIPINKDPRRAMANIFPHFFFIIKSF